MAVSRKQSPPQPESGLMADLETAIRQLVTDVELDPDLRVKAVQAGVKLLETQHKIRPDDDGEDSFFSGKLVGQS